MIEQAATITDKAILLCDADAPESKPFLSVFPIAYVKRHEYIPVGHPCQLAFVINYPHKIPLEWIGSFPLGVINFHPAPLPAYRGRNGVAHGILNGERTWAVTAHYMDADFDTGPVIDWRLLLIYDTDTAHTLWQRSQEAMCELFAHVGRLALDASRKLFGMAQDNAQAHYYSKYSLSGLHDCTGLSGDELNRRVRALTFPGKPKPYIVVDGYKYELTLREDK